MELARNQRINSSSPDIPEHASVAAQNSTYSGRASYDSIPNFEMPVGVSQDAKAQAIHRHAVARPTTGPPEEGSSFFT